MPTTNPSESAKADAKATANDAKNAAQKTAADAKSAAKDVAQTAKSAAKDVAQSAKQTATDLAGQAKEEATDAAQKGKEQATGVLSDVAEALHDTSDSLREHDRDAFADYADQAASQIEAFTSGIRDRNVGELLDEAERFARREPGLFIGGAFLLGIFGARFLKASASEAGPDRSTGGRSQDGGRRMTTTGARALPTGTTPRPGYATGSSVTSGLGYSTAASRTAGGATSPAGTMASDAMSTGTAAGGAVGSGGVSLPTTRPAGDDSSTTL